MKQPLKLQLEWLLKELKLCLKKAQKKEVHALKHTSLAAKRSAHKGDTTSLEESRGGMSYSIKMHERHSSSVYFTEKLQLIKENV